MVGLKKNQAMTSHQNKTKVAKTKQTQAHAQ